MASEGAYKYQSDFARKYVAEGEAKGREEGREVALLSLSALLRYRFGPIPSGVLQRLEAADLATLRRWASSVESAQSLADLLGG